MSTVYTVPTLGRDKVPTPSPPMSGADKSPVPERECHAGQFPVLTCMPFTRHLISLGLCVLISITGRFLEDSQGPCSSYTLFLRGGLLFLS